MKNPIDANLFKHYLEFKSLGMVDFYQICEPIGFDGAKLVKEQEAKRHARSREYFALDGLEFRKDYVSGFRETLQQINPQGDISTELDLGLEWILEALKKDGINTKVYYHFSENDVFFPTVFQLDFSEKGFTDWETFVKCKLVQNDKVAELKIKEDDKVNLFVNEDYKGNPITPMPTLKILRKGLIESKESQINLQEEIEYRTYVQGQGAETLESYFNPAINIVRYELKHTVGHTENGDQITGGLQNPSNDVEELYYYFAQKETFNLKVNIKNLKWKKKLHNDDGYCDFKFFIRSGYSATSDEFYYNNLIYETQDSTGQENTTDLDTEITIPYIATGGKVYIYFYIKTRMSNDFQGTTASRTTVYPYEIKLSADVKSLNLVIPVVRYVDYIKQAVKCINDLPVDGGEFEIGGEFEDLVVWNKRMITGKLDQLFTSPKEALESISFLNFDHEKGNTGIQIIEGDKFYEDVEIAVWHVSPNNNISSEFNPKASLKKLEYNHTNFSNDRDVKGSDKVIHATSSWNIPNELGKEDFTVKIDLILDPIYKQDAIDLEVKKPTTLTDREDKVFLDNIIELPPATKNSITLRLLVQGNGNIRKILNYSLDGGEDNDLGIDWNTWGFVVGQQITINNEVMIFNDIEENEDGTGYMLILTAPTQSNFQGDLILTIEYFYQGVLYTTQTTEGFSIVNGVSEGFGMLKYSPRRNLKRFERFLAMSMLHNDVIKNVEYKNNGTLETRLLTETESVIENAPFLKANMPQPYTNDKVFTLETVPAYSDVLQFYQNYILNKGYVRFVFPDESVKRAFIKTNSYLLKEGKCNTVIEEKFYTEKLDVTINSLEKKIIIEGVEVFWWEFRNDKFKAYDKNNQPLCNWIDFNLLILNSISYPTKQEVITVLNY